MKHLQNKSGVVYLRILEFSNCKLDRKIKQKLSTNSFIHFYLEYSKGTFYEKPVLKRYITHNLQIPY